MKKNPFLPFVEALEASVEAARATDMPAPGHRTMPAGTGETAVIFAPHPDDECIVGLLPLRLMREAGWRIVVVPVTFGRDPARRPGRRSEQDAARAFLGWDVWAGREGMDPLTSEEFVRSLEDLRPQSIFFPHAGDWNTRHEWTHRMIMEALGRMPEGFECRLFETEFWAPMGDPNRMVEGDAKTVADLVAATALHRGETVRNPYHLLLPAWMMDNVRRGAELVGGQGAAAPDFRFAALYRESRWTGGRPVPVEGERMLPVDALKKERRNRKGEG